MKGALVLAALVAVLLVPGTATALEQRSYTNAAGTRAYFLHVPPGGAAGKPLMVWLHGCGGPRTMEAGHALAKVADERGFVLAYPVQPASANPTQCWNWFLDEHIHRGRGEASIIAGITTSLIGELGTDPDRVYVGGYSAGGAMTTVMGAAYPDLYAAISPQAGLPYAFDAGAKAYAEMGERARPMPALFLQPLADELSNYAVGRANLLQWLTTDDHADDGAANGSVAKTPASVAQQTFAPVAATVERYVEDGCELARFLTLPLDHLSAGYLVSEDAGLPLQREMMDFLLGHRLGARCG